MSSVVKVLPMYGILDYTKCVEFGKKISELLASGPNYILLDCRDVTFMDDSGIGALISAFRSARKAGCELVFCSINQQISILFEMTGMDTVCKMFPDQDAFYATIDASE